MKRAKPKPPDAFRPWPAVILAVDTAERSGHSIHVCGSLRASGEFDLTREPHRANEIVREALELAREQGLKAVLVLEAPFAGIAQGQWRGAWRIAWAQEGGARARIVQVQPSTWRARVLAPGMHCARREVVRPHEQLVAAVHAGYPTGPDESPAVLIGYWATRAGEVGAKINPRPRPRGGKAA